MLNDWDLSKITMLTNNLRIYGVNTNNLEIHCKDFLKMEPVPADLIILALPWGDQRLENYSTMDLDTIMNPTLTDCL